MKKLEQMVGNLAKELSIVFQNFYEYGARIHENRKICNRTTGITADSWVNEYLITLDNFRVNVTKMHENIIVIIL